MKGCSTTAACRALGGRATREGSQAARPRRRSRPARRSAGRTPVEQDGAQGVDGEHAHRLARVARRAAEVRREDDVLQLEQLRRHGGLVLEDVERGAGDPALDERVDERALVDDRAARRVHEHGGRSHRRERGARRSGGACRP